MVSTENDTRDSREAALLEVSYQRGHEDKAAAQAWQGTSAGAGDPTTQRF